jgi:anaerobic magnesium-protoporphyrin IX monomethyl ester cyclase
VKIVFICLIEDLNIQNLRYLSSYLRAQGHTTELIFLPWNLTDKALHSGNSFRYPYPESVLEQVAEHCKGAQLVGLSLMTCHFDNAVHVTRYLRKRIDAPIIWGGIHPTLRPGECLEYADMACVGEGELGLGRLVADMSAGIPWQKTDIKGIWKKSDVGRPTFEPGPIVEDLNIIPPADYDFTHQFMLYEGKLIQITGPLYAKCNWFGHHAMFSRGCPYVCTYCCNNALRNLHNRKLPVRWRSVDNSMQELETVMKVVPGIETISFADDAFLAQPLEVLADFSARYKKSIGLPFSLLTTPRSVNEDKIAVLLDAGLYSVGIGIQSGSQRIYKSLYARPETLKEITVASQCFKQVGKKHKKQILARYDLILDNPWETQEDVTESIRLCTTLAKPFNLAMFTLTLYPGTELYNKARKEGMISDDLNQVYRSSQLVIKRKYLNGVFIATSANAPRWVILMLLKMQKSAPVSLPYAVAYIFEWLKYIKGFFNYASKGEWKVIAYLFRQAWARVTNIFKPREVVVKRPMFSGAPGQFSETA